MNIKKLDIRSYQVNQKIKKLDIFIEWILYRKK